MSELLVIEFHQVWGGSLEEGSIKVREFFESPEFEEISIIPDSITALRKLCHDFTLHIVTARPNYAEAVTKKFISKYFHNIFTEVHFGNHYAVDGLPISKAEICKRINAVILIDDSLKYAKNCAAEGIPVVLFGEYPWNRPEPLDRETYMTVKTEDSRLWMIQEARDWNAVLDLVYTRLNITPSNLKDKFLIAAVQMTSTNDQSSNIATIDRLVSQAVANGAVFVCLPECCTYMAYNRSELYTVSESVTSSSPMIIKLSTIAQKNGCWLSVGGFPERDELIGEKVCNSHFLIDPSGTVIEPIYRKIHLFDNPLTKLEESVITAAGDKKVVIDTGFVKLGLTVCYDLRFSALYTSLCDPKGGSSSGGAEIVLIPSAFTVPTGRAHWEVLLRARAIENQVYVVAAAQCGKHSDKRESYGHTMIVDPWGKIGKSDGYCHAY
jgi:deaminated glutathione amidase